jgi:hypothetical protein
MSFTDNWVLEMPAEGTVEFDDALNANMSAIDGALGGGVITAGETLAIRDIVGVKTDGKAWKVDGGGPTIAVGIVHTGANAESPAKILTKGRLGGFTFGTVGGVVWSDGSGDTTQTKPSSNPQKLGTAYSATQLEIEIASPEDSTIVKSTSNNKKIVSGTSTVTGQLLEIVSGLATIDNVVATIAGENPVYEPTLNEMAVRVQKSATAGKFHIYISKLDGTSAGRWVAGTTTRTVHWIAMGT